MSSELREIELIASYGVGKPTIKANAHCSGFPTRSNGGRPDATGFIAAMLSTGLP